MTATMKLALLSMLSLAVMLIAPFAGLGDIADELVRQQILYESRLPRTLFAFVAGGLAQSAPDKRHYFPSTHPLSSHHFINPLLYL